MLSDLRKNNRTENFPASAVCPVTNISEDAGDDYVAVVERQLPVPAFTAERPPVPHY
jgi:hypothetical protein